MSRNLACAIRVALFATLAVAVSGCGPQKFTVSGKVTYNGAVLKKPDGSVLFLGPQGEQVDAPISADGTYQASGVPAGMNKIAVYYMNPKVAEERKKRSRTPPKEVVETYLTPDKYALPDTSGLTLDVKKDTTHDIDITGPAIP